MADQTETPLVPDESERERYMQQLSAAAQSTFWGYLGCRIISAEPRKAVVSLNVQPHHLNLLGIVHGGVLSSLLDNAMGLAVILTRPDEKTVTTNLNVHFVSSLRSGTLTVTAEIVHESRKMMTATAMITGEDGQLTAMGTGSFRVI